LDREKIQKRNLSKPKPIKKAGRGLKRGKKGELFLANSPAKEKRKARNLKT